MMLCLPAAPIWSLGKRKLWGPRPTSPPTPHLWGDRRKNCLFERARSTMVELKDCYFAQLQFCAEHYVPGLDTFGQILTCVSLVSIALGVLLIGVSTLHRETKAKLLNARAAPPIFVFSQFEWFVVLFTISNTISGVALAIASFAGTSSTVFLSLMGLRSLLVFVATLVFVDIVLRSVDLQTPFIRRLRTRFLPSLVIPVLGTFAFTVYQARYSDYSHAHADEEPWLVDRYHHIMAASSVLYILCWLLMLVLVLVGRHAYSQQLFLLMRPTFRSAVVRKRPSFRFYEERKWGLRAVSDGAGGGGARGEAELEALLDAVEAANYALNWFAAAIGLFVVYNVAYSLMVLLYSGAPPMFWYLTMFVNFASPFVISIPLFLFFFLRMTRKLFRLVREDARQRGQIAVGVGPPAASSDDGPVPANQLPVMHVGP
ncbi:hypothetical protein DFJ73DRAFT_871490 [Zopfochytrium polystomum]|nr:hypothetical protein DFJ73DRAFT_871490 [Zopfochytrium polystomum]